MKERPMLFNGDMVRAILDGRKTHTRRPMKVQPPESWGGESERAAMVAHCPHGVPGDRIWVRETWNVKGLAWGQSIEFSKISSPDAFHYRATDDGGWKPYWGKWRPSIHMPRWACRIVLEITDVRVQRVQEISEADAISEGLMGPHHLSGEWSYGNKRKGEKTPMWFGNPIEAFQTLWNDCYGSDAWERNDWVWALTFKRVAGESK